MNQDDLCFGTISGISTFLGLSLHIVFLLLLYISGSPCPLLFLIASTLGARFFCEWLFWKRFQTRMDFTEKLKDWRMVVNRSLFSHPNIVVSLSMMVADGICDAMLINMALKMSVSSVWVFISILGCQMLSSPIQGFLSDYFSQKSAILFAALMCLLAHTQVIGIFSLNSLSLPLFSFIGLASLAPQIKILLLICGKGLLGNLSVISRAAIADVILVKTEEKI